MLMVVKSVKFYFLFFYSVVLFICLLAPCWLVIPLKYSSMYVFIPKNKSKHTEVRVSRNQQMPSSEWPFAR